MSTLGVDGNVSFNNSGWCVLFPHEVITTRTPLPILIDHLNISFDKLPIQIFLPLKSGLPFSKLVLKYSLGEGGRQEGGRGKGRSEQLR